MASTTEEQRNFALQMPYAEPDQGDRHVNSSASDPSFKGGIKIGPATFTFWRGRVALYATLKALGIGRGDSVVVPGYTCFAVPSAVCFTGAEPVYADIEPAVFNISLETILSAMRSKPLAKVKAILIQHTYGIPADTHRIVSWARERGIFTIEDCAHVWGSRYRGQSGEWRPVGTIADAAFFSSQWTKPTSTGLGGWVETMDPNLRDAIKRFRTEDCISPSKSEVIVLSAQVGVRKILSHPRIDGVLKKVYQAFYSRGLLVGTSSKEELRGGMPIGYAKRMSSFQERLLVRRRNNPSILEHRRRLKGAYDAALHSVGLTGLQFPQDTDPVLLRYPFRVVNKAQALTQAKGRGIELGDWYTHPIDRPEGLDAGVFAYNPGMCPEGERAAAETINLPMESWVKTEDVQEIAKFLKEVA